MRANKEMVFGKTFFGNIGGASFSDEFFETRMYKQEILNMNWKCMEA